MTPRRLSTPGEGYTCPPESCPPGPERFGWGMATRKQTPKAAVPTSRVTRTRKPAAPRVARVRAPAPAPEPVTVEMEVPVAEAPPPVVERVLVPVPVPEPAPPRPRPSAAQPWFRPLPERIRGLALIKAAALAGSLVRGAFWLVAAATRRYF